MSDGDTCAHYKYVKCLLCHQQRLLRADNDAESAEVKSWSESHRGETGHDYWYGFDCAGEDELCRRIRESNG